jgi:hypothetical protein
MPCCYDMHSTGIFDWITLDLGRNRDANWRTISTARREESFRDPPTDMATRMLSYLRRRVIRAIMVTGTVWRNPTLVFRWRQSGDEATPASVGVSSSAQGRYSGTAGQCDFQPDQRRPTINLQFVFHGSRE